MGEDDIFTPVWTVELLTEVERNLIGEKFGKSEKQAKRRIELMRRAFPFAEEWGTRLRATRSVDDKRSERPARISYCCSLWCHGDSDCEHEGFSVPSA